jgi:hypothetical protein
MLVRIKKEYITTAGITKNNMLKGAVSYILCSWFSLCKLNYHWMSGQVVASLKVGNKKVEFEYSF